MKDGVDQAAVHEEGVFRSLQTEVQEEDAFRALLDDLDVETRNVMCDLMEEGDSLEAHASTAAEGDRDVQEVDFEGDEGEDPFFPATARSKPSTSSSSSSSSAGAERMVRPGVSHASVWDVAKRVGLEWEFAGTALQFSRPGGRKVGRVWFIGDLSVKAECNAHQKCTPKCALFIDVVSKSGQQLRSCSDVLKKVLEWLALADTLSHDDHRKEAVAVKVSLGMKPRVRV